MKKGLEFPQVCVWKRATCYRSSSAWGRVIFRRWRQIMFSCWDPDLSFSAPDLQEWRTLWNVIRLRLPKGSSHTHTHTLACDLSKMSAWIASQIMLLFVFSSVPIFHLDSFFFYNGWNDVTFSNYFHEIRLIHSTHVRERDFWDVICFWWKKKTTDRNNW